MDNQLGNFIVPGVDNKDIKGKLIEAFVNVG